MRAGGRGVGVLAFLAVVVVAALLALRPADRAALPRAATGDAPPPVAAPAPGAPTENVPATAVVTGTVAGKHGPIVAVPVIARAGGEVVAEAMTDPLGRYRLEVPAGVDLDIEARPVPDTGLAPARRLALALAGEELTVDFELEKGGSARGTVKGERWAWFDVVAVRVEDYPEGPDPPPLGALEGAPKVAAQVTRIDTDGPEHLVAFEFHGLDPAAIYRLALLNRGWALDRPVLFRAGDDQVSAHAVAVFRIFVEARDIETGELLPRFRVTLWSRAGAVLVTLDGEEGRVSRCVPRPERVRRGFPWQDAELDENIWELVVAADGYFDEKLEAEGVHRVSLQRLRAPNVALRIAYDDGGPVEGEIEGRFESLDDPDGLRSLVLRREEAGRWRTTLPPGRWRIHIERPKAFHDVARILDVEVPAEGTAEAEQRYPRGGTVTFEGHVTLAREIDGERQKILADKGTWEDVPVGRYSVMRGDEEAGTFEVVAGSIQVVPAPPRRDGD